MSNLRLVLEDMQSNGMRGKVWVDGSFLTEKLNPQDVDLLFHVTKAELRAMDARERGYFNNFTHTSLVATHQCDNYVYVQDDAVPESAYMYAYWLKQFGFSRGSDMKGIAIITLPYLVTP